ncbi:hypothetical protein RLW55_01310 [Hyphomicrobium sp. B1]|uniref:hypothetical protein n=1 Tax=unclassified Hyphomicrobium TaxID=2619925 RepID=UPI00391CE125
MTTTQPLRQDRTDLDDRDEDILFERVTRRAHIKGPRVGDFCIMKTGETRRFTHDWGDALQVTVRDQAGSFYFASTGNLDYSGSLDPAIRKTNLEECEGLREGAVWFFHHNEHRAHNGVAAMIPCRVYREIDVAVAPEFEDVVAPEIVPVTEDIVFDEKDAALLGTAMRFRSLVFKPLVGDYVILASGEVRRLAFAYSNRFQITTPRFACSFHLHDVGTMSCSGAFPESVPTADLEDAGFTRAARAWIFHHGRSGGGRGVDVVLPVRVWREVVR